ncbi:hypothetical protein ACHAXA_004101 [Cyclostephanos tholiformis]|uniref:Enoyl reductase (ER) domain-containing protein n=1 Tax=Cyclostephanos tholiformis TaxID=382380 RepID=A0ABD3SH32_9STRA
MSQEENEAKGGAGATFAPSLLPYLLPTSPDEELIDGCTATSQTKCISTGRRGGMEQLRLVRLRPGVCTIGYNVRHNWGLYESAKKYVGWPIVPGLDVAGTVESISDQSDGTDRHALVVGDRVFGCSLFDGGGRNKFTNKSILNSAAGGFGSFLVQMSKILGFFVVGVVGSSSKVNDALDLGCDVVVDKSIDDLLTKAENASPAGYSTIMDANGVSTLNESYDHLAPSGSAMLSPLEWFRMAGKVAAMPKFDPMDLTVSNKSVLGFNLSFFADEIEVLSDMFDQILIWIEERKLRCPRVCEMPMESVAKAHEFIQSGKSSGKIVLKTTSA